MNAFAINSGNKEIYFRYASYMLHQLKRYDMDVFILTLKENNISKQWINRWKSMNSRAIIYNVDEYLKDIGLPNDILSHYSRATFLKLSIPFIQDFNKYDKILYLDTDMLILDDILPLFDIDLEHNFFGMVEDYNMKAGCKIGYVNHLMTEYKQYGLEYQNGERYHNAGLVMLNITEIRNNLDYFKNVLMSLMSVYYRNPWEYADQDTINMGFKVTTFPDKFNKLRGFSPREQNDVILHFISIKNDFNKIVENFERSLR